MKQYHITGMSCAACQARVEKAVSGVEGVTACSVSLLTNSMGVEGSADNERIIQAVEKAGYGASPKASASKRPSPTDDALKDTETPRLRKRLFTSLVFLLMLLYFSMGVHMFGLPLPPFLQGNWVGLGLIQLLLSGIIMVINQKFFVSGFRSLFHLAPNMDTLIAVGSSASFLYSTVVLFVMTAYISSGQAGQAAALMNEFYFESAAMILTLITVGKTLEAYSKGKTTGALRGLMKLAPQTAVLLRDGREITVPVEEIQKGDVFVVRSGESIPADGIVLEGSGAVDESALTGESLPTEKTAGSTVSSATINRSGYLLCRATRVGEDTTLSEIINMVSDAAATKAPVARLADRISLYFVPAVMGLALLATIVWLLLGAPAGIALARGICVLVVSCPCALGLATPVAIMVGSGVGAKNGILFKTAEALQETGRVDIVVLDKTGTITHGAPIVTDVLPWGDISETELLTAAASLEQKSEHPLGAAVCAYALEKDIPLLATDRFRTLAGSGVSAVLNGKEMIGGSAAFVKSQLSAIPADFDKQSGALAEQGKTPMAFAQDGKLLGMIAVADTVKEDSAEAVAQMKALGLSVVMLTGDNQKTARVIAGTVGVDAVLSDVKPDEKGAAVQQLSEKGRVLMIGDGINDAPALTLAHVGMAIGAGTDVAIDAADVVLMKSRLSDAAAAIRLSRQTYRNIKQNLFWALFYNVLLIPVAAGAYAALGLTMSPVLGAAAMSLSSVFVITNALRLNTFPLFRTKHNKAKKSSVVLTAEDPIFQPPQNETEETTMKRTMNIEGMMCGHCEAAVKKALEAIEGVAKAEVSHEKKLAVVTLTQEVSNEVLKKAVEDKDYTVTGIE